MQRIAQFSLHLSPTTAGAGASSSPQQDTVYIANRGIIAVRVARTCKQLGYRVVGSYCASDSAELFVRELDDALPLEEEDGPAAYMNIARVIANCRQLKARFVHPGIGLLSESSEFARACDQAGLLFIGPRAEHLELFGSKLETCLLASKLGIPTLSLGKITRRDLGKLDRFPLLFKASNGGGGIGLRVVESPAHAEEMFDRCVSEAKRAFGTSSSGGEDELLCEVYLTRCRHVEVQLVGDGLGDCFTLADRECSVQRKFQKVIEIAPCPNLADAVRHTLHSTARKLAAHVKYRGVGTFEFLVSSDDDSVFFIECNPRLQVEHTVTEEIFAPQLDLVRVQLEIATGQYAKSSGGFTQRPGFAVQCRICAEKYTAGGGGIEPVGPNAVVRALDFPRGAGVRVESICQSGYKPNFRFDSLLVQLVVSSPSADFSVACGRVLAALEETRIVGCDTNLGLLRAIVREPVFQLGRATTQWLDRELMPAPRFQQQVAKLTAAASDAAADESSQQQQQLLPTREPFWEEDDTLVVSSPMTCTVVQVLVKPGDQVVANKTVLAVLSALKMEHEVRSPRGGVVGAVAVRQNALAASGQELLRIALDSSSSSSTSQHADVLSSLNNQGEDSPAYKDFIALVRYNTLDESRADKTSKRMQEPGRLTARQVIAAVFDEAKVELGRLASNGYQKHSVGDGVYMVKGEANARELGVARPKALVVAYDYTVLAGTQGLIGHKKKDRAFELALRERHPVVYFAEGGGGRAGDAKKGGFTSSGLEGPAFTLFAKLAVQRVPLIGAVSGFCFAGNAALLGMCDICIATENVSLGMGGPAMIEGGGLGVVRAEDVGPVRTHYALGVVDVLVKTDHDMVRTAKQALSYFQGPCRAWRQRTDEETLQAHKLLRNIVPTANRRLAFDMRQVLRNVMDVDSLLELKSGFAPNLITALARLEGKPVGVVANNCAHLSGTLDAHAASKLAKFLQLCSRHGLPLVSFCDTPGFLVGVESERQGLVKLAGELFVSGVGLEVPLVLVAVRRCVGLGGQAMCGGDLKQPVLTMAWPTAEFAAMGLEGAVRLGFREELKQDPALFDTLLAVAQEGGKAVTAADHFEIDDVIDPADTRQVVINGLDFAGAWKKA